MSPTCYRHLAACDLAIVQGGLTTTMELTASGRPFIYFPLARHFEQNLHVHHRLRRHRAGRRMEYDRSPPEAIARAIAEEIGRPVDYRPVARRRRGARGRDHRRAAVVHQQESGGPGGPPLSMKSAVAAEAMAGAEPALRRGLGAGLAARRRGRRGPLRHQFDLVPNSSCIGDPELGLLHDRSRPQVGRRQPLRASPDAEGASIGRAELNAPHDCVMK